MNEEVREEKQKIVIGVDCGKKKEGYTIKSKAATYCNIQVDAIDWISQRLERRRNARNARRYRKTPYRKQRSNRSCLKNRVRPSIRARWDWRISIITKVKKLYPIIDIIYENIRAKKIKANRIWNKSFSVLEIGKRYGYSKLKEIANLILVSGFRTSELRKKYNLTKNFNKLSDKFEAHCVDSWVMANSICEGTLDNKRVLRIIPIQFHRRQLHLFCPGQNGKRRSSGGTRSCGLKRGSIVKHKKFGKVYLGGNSSRGISLHEICSGKRIYERAKIEDCKFICYSNYRYYNV